MFVEKRKENYDELLLLASDARARRTRTNRWSTGIIISAMLGMAAYVAAMSQQMSALRDAADNVQQERNAAIESQSRLIAERDTLQAELDALGRYQDLYAELMPSQTLTNSIAGLGGEDVARGTVINQSERIIAKSNIVWMVDGSRRFPMVDGDVLWIPEGAFWVRMKLENGERRLYRESARAGDTQNTANPISVPMEQNPHREAVSKGSYTCVEIRLHDDSLRPVFRAQGYVDVEVTYFKSDNRDQTCVSGRRPDLPAE